MRGLVGFAPAAAVVSGWIGLCRFRAMSLLTLWQWLSAGDVGWRDEYGASLARSPLGFPGRGGQPHQVACPRVPGPGGG
jgi:hypothetical protein